MDQHNTDHILQTLKDACIYDEAIHYVLHIDSRVLVIEGIKYDETWIIQAGNKSFATGEYSMLVTYTLESTTLCECYYNTIDEYIMEHNRGEYVGVID